MWGKAAAAVACLVVGVVLGVTGYALVAGGGDDSRGESAETDADLIVFLDRAATYDTWRTLRMTLEDDDRVVSLDYFDRDESLVEFRELFRSNEEMLERAERNPDLIPPSYRLRLTQAARNELQATAEEFQRLYGVMKVAVVADCDDLDPSDYESDIPRCRP